jgi:ribosome maturation factor RimP
MKENTRSEQLDNITREALADSPFELVLCQFVKAGSDWTLRIFIDHPEGVTLDHCVTVTRLVREKLETSDPSEDDFDIEVSSPGVDRPLVRREDYDRFRGERVFVKAYRGVDGLKAVTGTLERCSDEGVTVHAEEDGKPHTFAFDNIAKATLKPILNFC